MPQERLSNDEVTLRPTYCHLPYPISNASHNTQFLTRLTTLLSSTHSATHGSVYLTQKPLIPTTSESSTQILIRATNGLSKPHRTAKPKAKSGEKVKFATVVEISEIDTFYTRYAEVCKKGMEALRKRDKKKAKEKAKAKKKGKGVATAAGEKVGS